ncbi:MAG: alanine racemase [Oscillospiraceae bacterium]|nr:alanine racemase [Oscillospiraceae bacterium]
MNEPKRTWAEVDLGAIRHNYEQMRKRAGDGVKFLGVVKADAYGHGALQVAGMLQRAGADYLAVACLDEAEALRQGGITLPILILGVTDPKYTEELIRMEITAAVADMHTAGEMSKIATGLGRRAKIHLKVDTGMGRIGFICRGDRDPAALLAQAADLPGLDAEGIFTHFATSDMPGEGDAYTEEQYEAFRTVVREAEQIRGKRFPIRHCANSGAMTGHPDKFLDMVRPGIALYGCYPSELTGNLDLRPAMSVRTRVVQVRELMPGDSVSYGRRFIAERPVRTAVVPIGYADGLHRVLSGRIDMLVRGRRAPQIGRICMDMCMLDVTDIPEVREGDVVTLFGEDGGARIPVEELAEKAGTISYEMLCAMSPRVERVWVEH